MKLYKYIIFFLLFTQFNGSAQISPGSKQVSLSHSGVAQANDVFTLFTNPSGLAQLNWREFGIYYSPSPFGIDKLANAFAAYHEPTAIGSFGFGFMTYGFDLYKETKFTLAYANSFSNSFMIGVSIFYNSISIQNYGNDNSFSISVGGLSYILSNLRLGFLIDNLTRSSFGDYKDQIPVILNLGLSYDIIPELTINGAVEKDMDRTASIRFGVDYLIIQYLNIRFGAMNEPASFSAGVGINYSLFELDYGVFNHQDLGFTHQVDLIIQFGTSKPRNEKIREYLGK